MFSESKLSYSVAAADFPPFLWFVLLASRFPWLYPNPSHNARATFRMLSLSPRLDGNIRCINTSMTNKANLYWNLSSISSGFLHVIFILDYAGFTMIPIFINVESKVQREYCNFDKVIWGLSSKAEI